VPITDSITQCSKKVIAKKWKAWTVGKNDHPEVWMNRYDGGELLCAWGSECGTRRRPSDRIISPDSTSV